MSCEGNIGSWFNFGNIEDRVFVCFCVVLVRGRDVSVKGVH